MFLSLTEPGSQYGLLAVSLLGLFLGRAPGQESVLRTGTGPWDSAILAVAKKARPGDSEEPLWWLGSPDFPWPKEHVVREGRRRNPELQEE